MAKFIPGCYLFVPVVNGMIFFPCVSPMLVAGVHKGIDFFIYFLTGQLIELLGVLFCFSSFPVNSLQYSR